MVLEVPCEGVPEPEMSWKLNDAEGTTNDNVKVKCAAGVAKLMFIPGKRYFFGRRTKIVTQILQVQNG